MTFADVLGKFRAKVAEENFKKEISELESIFDMFTMINEIRTKFQPFTTEFMDDGKKKLISDKVPLAEDKCLFRLDKKINWINEVREKEIPSRTNRIISIFSFNLEKDTKFMASLHNWEKNPVDKKHLERVKKNIGSMKSEYKAFQEDFKKNMEMANEVIAEIDAATIRVNQVFDIVWKTEGELGEDKDKDLLTEASLALTELLQCHEYMCNVLNKLEEGALSLNKHRCKWADFLIGMRRTLKSDREPVELTLIKRIENKLRGEKSKKSGTAER